MCVTQDAVVMQCSLFELYALKNVPVFCARQNIHLLSALLQPKESRKNACFALFQFLLEICGCVSVNLHWLYMN